MPPSPVSGLSGSRSSRITVIWDLSFIIRRPPCDFAMRLRISRNSQRISVLGKSTAWMVRKSGANVRSGSKAATRPEGVDVFHDEFAEADLWERDPMAIRATSTENELSLPSSLYQMDDRRLPLDEETSIVSAGNAQQADDAWRMTVPTAATPEYRPRQPRNRPWAGYGCWFWPAFPMPFWSRRCPEWVTFPTKAAAKPGWPGDFSNSGPTWPAVRP